MTMGVESNSPQDAMSILTSAIEIYLDVARFILGQIQFHMINNPQLPTDPYNKLTFTNTVLVGGIIGLVSGTIILGCIALFRKTAKNRRPNMNEIQDYLELNYGIEYADKLLYMHPKAIIENKKIIFIDQN